jgi:hypothetical protein
MIGLVKNKIGELQYKSPESIEELIKLLGISRFVIQDKSRECTPPYIECLEAINNINALQSSISSKGESEFNRIKSEALLIYENLGLFLSSLDSRGIIRNDLLYGEKTASLQHKIKFALLMVEQNNLDFFKERGSHLPSQPHDRLSSHYILHFSATQTILRFHSSEIPDHIKAESERAITDVMKESSIS